MGFYFLNTCVAIGSMTSKKQMSKLLNTFKKCYNHIFCHFDWNWVSYDQFWGRLLGSTMLKFNKIEWQLISKRFSQFHCWHSYCTLGYIAQSVYLLTSEDHFSFRKFHLVTKREGCLLGPSACLKLHSHLNLQIWINTVCSFTKLLLCLVIEKYKQSISINTTIPVCWPCGSS